MCVAFNLVHGDFLINTSKSSMDYISEKNDHSTAFRIEDEYRNDFIDVKTFHMSCKSSSIGKH